MECTERSISDDFAHYLRSIREKKGLTLQDVAEKTNLSKSYINRIENGERKAPSLPVIEALAKCFGVSVAELSNIASKDKRNGTKGELLSLETLLFSNQFTMLGKEVSAQVKNHMILLLKNIWEADWKDEFTDMFVIMQEVSKLKNTLSEEVNTGEY